jgi:hypothetical protein
MKIILGVLIVLIVSCSDTDKNSGEHEAGKHDYNELANPDSLKGLPISDYNTDNPDVENIQRPRSPIIQTTLDTSLLFGIWTSDPEGPHADFDFTSKSFYVVDYDGTGDMPYELKGDELTIYYNDFIQEGQIISVTKDTLKLKWKDFESANTYVRWRQ